MTHADLCVPISDSDILNGTGDDFSVGPVGLGFIFPYFGADQTDIFINSNGNLTFGGGNTSFTPTGFPSGPPRIAPFWDDFVITDPSQLRYNDTVAGQFTVIWNGAPYFGGGAGPSTFEAVLLGAGNAFGEAAGSIIFSYDAIGAGAGFWGTSTVGLNEGDGVRFETLSGVLGTAADGTITAAQTGLFTDADFIFRPNGRGGYTASVFNKAVPEPSTLALSGIGAACGLAYVVRRRRRGRIT
jgi:hypothetical protein